MVNTDALAGVIRAKRQTQADVANHLGIKRSTMSSKMTGKTKFNVDEVEKICKFLGIESPSEIVQIFFTH